MGVELRSGAGTFELRHLAWALALNLAEHYGWKPSGTVYTNDPAWDGAYDANSGQTIGREDAEALADALHRALEAPDLHRVDEQLALAFARQGLSVTPGWSKQLRHHLSELIEFLRSGSVQVT